MLIGNNEGNGKRQRNQTKRKVDENLAQSTFCRFSSCLVCLFVFLFVAVVVVYSRLFSAFSVEIHLHESVKSALSNGEK